MFEFFLYNFPVHLNIKLFFLLFCTSLLMVQRNENTDIVNKKEKLKSK